MRPDAAEPLVVDASVCLKWLVPEEGSEIASRLLASHSRGELSIFMPDIAPVEVANALWSHRSDGLSHEDAADMVSDVLSSAIVFFESAVLLSRAMDIAYRVGTSVYDSLYVAAAEALEARFVTADKRLLSRVKADFPQAFLLGELGQ
jgi:predicted nucleic acid-binding protein